jgi:hypothetical protein
MLVTVPVSNQLLLHADVDDESAYSGGDDDDGLFSALLFMTGVRCRRLTMTSLPFLFLTLMVSDICN